jgi:hypothetical protein
MGSGESSVLDKVRRYRAWEGRHDGNVALGLEIPAAAAPIRLRPDFLDDSETNEPGPEPKAARPHCAHDPAKMLGRRAPCVRFCTDDVEHTFSSRAWLCRELEQNEKDG